jgi:hypothetical protein
MASRPKRKATGARRGRRAAEDLTRIEVEASKRDTALLRAVAKRLRGEPKKARALRAALEEALVSPEVKTAFDVFGTDLPDEAFAGVFDQPRQESWRGVDL